MKKIKKLSKIGLIFFSLYILLAFITPFNSVLHERSINNQISYLLSQEDLDTKSQLRFPEGYVFFNSILALSLIEHSAQQSTINSEVALSVDKLLVKLLSDKASIMFPDDLKLPNGAFFNGWVNFTLKKYLQSELGKLSQFHSRFQVAYDSISTEIIQSQIGGIEILETYNQSYWPADNLMCIASLPSGQNELSNRWIKHIQNTSQIDLIHHDDTNLRKARGSSQSLMIYILSQIDLEIANAENVKFERLLQKSILGIEFIREDLNNHDFSDVDSGPVIFGIGSVATIMNIKAQKAIGQRSRITEGFLNTIGLPINFNGKKFYLFKKEVMFDLFMLWIQT